MALTHFTSLPPRQRSALAFKDVLGLSLEETAEAMGTTVLGVKSALSRARATLAAARREDPPPAAPRELPELRRYALLFNARDWDGLRAMFAEDARVELVARWERTGHDATYFGRYAEVAEAEALRAEAGLADGVPVIAIFRGADASPRYFTRVTWSDGKICAMRDFYFSPWVARDARFVVLGS